MMNTRRSQRKKPNKGNDKHQEEHQWKCPRPTCNFSSDSEGKFSRHLSQSKACAKVVAGGALRDPPLDNNLPDGMEWDCEDENELPSGFFQEPMTQDPGKRWPFEPIGRS